jgi:hypothetical protein
MYAGGLWEPGNIAWATTLGITNEIYYDPGELTPREHILEVYDIGRAQCDANAKLMAHHLRVMGIPTGVTYLWGGSSPAWFDFFTFQGRTGPSFRTMAPGNGAAPPNPHFTFHALSRVNNVYYDPSYGTFGLTRFVEVMPPFSVNGTGEFHVPPVSGEALFEPRQQIGGSLPQLGHEHTEWTCPH